LTQFFLIIAKNSKKV